MEAFWALCWANSSRCYVESLLLLLWKSGTPYIIQIEMQYNAYREKFNNCFIIHLFVLNRYRLLIIAGSFAEFGVALKINLF